MSSLIYCLVSPNTIAEMNLKQYTLRRICSDCTAEGRMRSNYIQVEATVQTSFCIEIEDFDNKDESGNALLAAWLSFRMMRIRPHDNAKVRRYSLISKHREDNRLQ